MGAQVSIEVREIPLRLPPNALSLIDIYFAYTQCWFPILEKNDILRAAAQCIKGVVKVSPVSPESGDYAALWAVFTLASMQEVSALNSHQIADNFEDRPDPYHLNDVAKALIPLENGSYRLGHVQASLILSLAHIGRQEYTAAWMLVGQAIRISRLLNIDSATLSRTPDSARHSRSKHVFFGCFVLETLLATHTRRRPYLSSLDVACLRPINEDGPEEQQSWEDHSGFCPQESGHNSLFRGPSLALSTFNKLVCLMWILNNWCFERESPTMSLLQLKIFIDQFHAWGATASLNHYIDIQASPGMSAAPHTFGLALMCLRVATILNVNIAMLRRERHEYQFEGVPKAGATKCTKLLLLLLEVYVDTYGFHATLPTFGLILTLGFQRPWEGLRSLLLYDLDLDLNIRLQSMSHRVSGLWFPPCRTAAQPGSAEGSKALNTRPEGSLKKDSTAAAAFPRGTTVLRSLTAPAPLPPTAWFKTSSGIRNKISIFQAHLLFFSHRESKSSYQPSDAEDRGLDKLPPFLSYDERNIGPTMMPDSFPPFSPAIVQYPRVCNEPNVASSNPFPEVDEYGEPGRARIGFGVDYCFDESLNLGD